MTESNDGSFTFTVAPSQALRVSVKIFFVALWALIIGDDMGVSFSFHDESNKY